MPVISTRPKSLVHRALRWGGEGQYSVSTILHDICDGACNGAVAERAIARDPNGLSARAQHAGNVQVDEHTSRYRRATQAARQTGTFASKRASVECMRGLWLCRDRLNSVMHCANITFHVCTHVRILRGCHPMTQGSGPMRNAGKRTNVSWKYAAKRRTCLSCFSQAGGIAGL